MKRVLALVLALMLAALPALAMTEERAQTLAKQAESRAKTAKRFWVYPEGEGAWVFYATGYNSDKALFEGGFLYVSEAATARLGGFSRRVASWGYCDYDVPLFTSVIQRDGGWQLHAAMLEGGAPKLLQNVGQLSGLDVQYGNLRGYVPRGGQSPDYVFLGVRDGALVEIAAQPITEAVARKIGGMPELIDALRIGEGADDGATVDGFLYRNAVPGRFRSPDSVPQGSVTVNVTRDGKPGHVFVYLDETGRAVAERGWENEVIVYEGTDPVRHDIGLEVVETVGE